MDAMMEKIVIVTGGFDPIHSGHMAYFRAARQLGNKLVVGINSDSWLTRKKGRPFMSWDERCGIIKELKMVDHVMQFNDDNNSSTDCIHKCRLMWPSCLLYTSDAADE